MKNKKMLILSILSFLSLIFTIFFFVDAFYQRSVYSSKYDKAKQLIKEEEYDEGIKILNSLKDYKDSNQLLEDAKKEQQYATAISLYDSGNYKEALLIFMQINDFKNSVEYIKKSKYNLAIYYYENEKYDEAKQLFSELDNYMKSKYFLAQINIAQKEESQKIIYTEACKLFNTGLYNEALENFKKILDYKDSKQRAKKCEEQIRRKNLNNAISGGIRYSAAIFKNGTVKAVGDNNKKQCEVKKFNNIISVDAGGCLTIGLKKNGKIQVAGTYDEGFSIDTSKKKWNEEKFIDVAAGERFVVGLTKNGTVVGDGHNDDNQISFKGWGKEKFIAIDAGWRFTVGLTENKELKFSGLYGDQLKDFKKHKDEWKDVVNISAAGGDTTSKKRGSGHTVGLKSDGTVVVVGGDKKWKQYDVKEWRNIIKVVAGDWYTVGLKNNGQVLITGKNESGTKYIETDKLEQINKKADVVDIAAGYGQTIFLHKDGSVSAFDFDDEQKTNEILKWRNLKMP